jgi:hypothetical protein
MDDDAFTIREFCRRNKISESFYHKLRPLGLGPRTMEILRARRITRQAEEDWRAEREAASKVKEPV